MFSRTNVVPDHVFPDNVFPDLPTFTFEGRRVGGRGIWVGFGCFGNARKREEAIQGRGKVFGETKASKFWGGELREKRQKGVGRGVAGKRDPHSLSEEAS
jgi:hypothetical protein